MRFIESDQENQLQAGRIIHAVIIIVTRLLGN